MSTNNETKPKDKNKKEAQKEEDFVNLWTI